MFKCVIDADAELRLLEERHVGLLFALTDGNRSHLQQWIPWIDWVKSVEESRWFIRESLKQFAEGTGFQAGIWYKGELAGVIGLNTIDWSNMSTVIGYWLAEAFQGKGLATRSCKALVDYALVELGLNRVEVSCAVGNHRSRAIPERLGFKQDGILREAELLHDRFVDHVVYSVLAREWKARMPSP